jgi:hypothetical protein
LRLAWETLNKSAFYGEPAQLCDAGINQIKVLATLILPRKFLHLFNQRFPWSSTQISESCHNSDRAGYMTGNVALPKKLLTQRNL